MLTFLFDEFKDLQNYAKETCPTMFLYHLTSFTLQRLLPLFIF